MRTTSILILATCLTISCSDRKGKSDAYGNFETIEVNVASEVQGKLVQFDVDEGKTFKAGDITGLIDTVQLSLRKEQLIAQGKATADQLTNILSQISVQEEQKKTLLIDKHRTENLLKDKAVPEKQLDDVNGKINVIDSEIASIKTQTSAINSQIIAINRQIDQVTDQINRSKITNPINGTVLEKYVELSEIITPGRVLYKIADIDQMILRVYISETQLSSVKTGQKVTVLIDNNNNGLDSMDGIISWISPQAEFTPKIIQTRDERVNLVYAMKINVKNDGRLKIGMPGEVKF